MKRKKHYHQPGGLPCFLGLLCCFLFVACAAGGQSGSVPGISPSGGEEDTAVESHFLRVERYDEGRPVPFGAAFQSPEQLQAFFEENEAEFGLGEVYLGRSFEEEAQKYGKEYFETNSLALVFLVNGSSAVQNEVAGLALSDGTLVLTVRQQAPSGGLMPTDMQYGFLFVEMGAEYGGYPVRVELTD